MSLFLAACWNQPDGAMGFFEAWHQKGLFATEEAAIAAGDKEAQKDKKCFQVNLPEGFSVVGTSLLNSLEQRVSECQH